MSGLSGWRAKLAIGLSVCLLLGACGAQRHGTDDPRRAVAASQAVGPEQVAAGSRALTTSRTVGQFGRLGTGAGQLQEPFGIAADARNGDLYVDDTEHWRIEKFTSSGRFLLGWGWGVADGRTNKLQTCTRKCFAGMEGRGAGEFAYPEGITVDNNPSSGSRGDVYIADIHAARVEKFSPTGRFLLMFGGGVNQTAREHHLRDEEDICPVHRGDVCGAGVNSQRAGALDLLVEGTFITVGPGGNVYVGERNHVKIFSPQGRDLSAIALTSPPAVGGPEAGGVSALVVNASGELYVVRNGVIGVNEYSPSGTLVRTLRPGGGERSYPEGPTPSMAMDPMGDIFIDVFVDEYHWIDEYSPSDVLLASFDHGMKATTGVLDREDGLPGMAYDPTDKRLYVVNVSHPLERVRIIEPPLP